MPPVYTDERYRSEVDDEDIHPECDSIYWNEIFAPIVHQKQCPKFTGVTTSYLHEDKHLPIPSEQMETLSI